MPGGEDTIDTLSLNGVTISGTLLIDVNTDGSCDTLAAQGDLDLSGLSLTVANPDQLNPQQTYTVITCSGTRTGKFTSLSGADGWYIQYMPDGSVNLAFSGGTLILVR
jgi:hypothetical protein